PARRSRFDLRRFDRFYLRDIRNQIKSNLRASDANLISIIQRRCLISNPTAIEKSPVRTAEIFDETLPLTLFDLGMFPTDGAIGNDDRVIGCFPDAGDGRDQDTLPLAPLLRTDNQSGPKIFSNWDELRSILITK